MEHIKTKRKKAKTEETLSREEFSAILKKAGENARKKAFKAGLKIAVLFEGEICYEYADGSIVRKSDNEVLRKAGIAVKKKLVKTKAADITDEAI